MKNKPLLQPCIKQGNCELKNRHSVVMVLLLVALMGCTRAGVQNLVEEIDDPNPARKYAEMYTKNLHGEFKWKRFSYIGPFNSFDTTFYDDTVVAIQVINDTAVSFMGKTFEYIDSSYKTHGVYIYIRQTRRMHWFMQTRVYKVCMKVNP